MSFTIREITENDRTWVKSIFVNYWGGDFSVSRGKKFSAEELPGFIAETGIEKVGLITYNINNKECEITTLNSLLEKNGIGTALIERVKQAAREENCKCLWLITTNDNTQALRFYQKLEFTIKAIHVNAMAESRKLKPGIPLFGNDEIPIRDEIELEYLF